MFWEKLASDFLRRIPCVAFLVVFIAALFFTVLLWAKARDPFQRVEFSLKTAEGETKGLVVLPKGVSPVPVVVFLHGAGGTVLQSGNDLRLFAELGLAAVDIEYNQTNQAFFDEEFIMLHNYLEGQNWVMRTDSGAISSNGGSSVIAWVGFSRGSQRTLSFALNHAEFQPRLYVRMAGGWVNELDEIDQKFNGGDSTNSSVVDFPISFNTHFLLLHAEQDDIFPIADVRHLAKLLKANGIPTELRVFPNVPHWFGDERDLLMREVAEYCANYLTPVSETKNSKPETYLKPLSRNVQPSYWYYWLPVAFISIVLSVFKYARWHKSVVSIPRDNWGKIITCAAWLLALAAIAETAFHLGLPHLQISTSRLKLTRRWLIDPKLTNDFDWLIQQPIWKQQPIRALMENVELADYNRKLVGWKVEEDIYRNFVLSPLIDSTRSEALVTTDLSWRRALWENFYPRIRHETNPESAARIVVRFLRERVTVVPWKMEHSEIETIWRTERTDFDGFERIYVATLRSVGIPARFDDGETAEIFANGQWHPAPQPIIFSLLSDNAGAGGEPVKRNRIIKSLNRAPQLD